MKWKLYSRSIAIINFSFMYTFEVMVLYNYYFLVIVYSNVLLIN